MSFLKTLLPRIKYFVREIIIVSIGILIAFQINSWDSRRKEKAERIYAYQSLLEDIASDLYVLNYYKDQLENSSDYYDRLFSGQEVDLDSLPYFIKTQFSIQRNNATYLGLKSSGKLSLLQNESIRKTCLLYYETYLEGQTRISERFFQLNGLITEYTIYNFPVDEDEKLRTKKTQTLLDQSSFKMLLYNHLQLIQGTIPSLEKSITLLKSLESKLQKELKIDAPSALDSTASDSTNAQ